MAVIGVPGAGRGRRAVGQRATAGLRQEIAVLNGELEARFGTTVSVRVDVNTGKFCRHGGAAGDWRRVNLAARLEQAAGPGGIIISSQTWRLVHDTMTAEAAGATQVELEVIDRFRT